ncbi:uncharacterized protein isoform X4 [Choristoneura fumiferana]|uniref:uncharacterized protein isoform X4 n=1 Tax=Choristoneura fumiferana TaxID=7141 RepID=UPI003D158296
MEPRTSRKDYKNHHYSGPRKNRKRVQGQMKRYHGEIKSRNEVWCKKRKMDDDPNINSSSAEEVEERMNMHIHTNIINTKLCVFVCFSVFHVERELWINVIFGIEIVYGSKSDIGYFLSRRNAQFPRERRTITEFHACEAAGKS